VVVSVGSGTTGSLGTFVEVSSVVDGAVVSVGVDVVSVVVDVEVSDDEAVEVSEETVSVVVSVVEAGALSNVVSVADVDSPRTMGVEVELTKGGLFSIYEPLGSTAY